MKRQKGRTILTFDGESRRFIILSLGKYGEFGLYDAEVDSIVAEDKLDTSIIDDSEKNFEQLLKISEKFKKKIKELTN